jgi:hypothetical protein
MPSFLPSRVRSCWSWRCPCTATDVQRFLNQLALVALCAVPAAVRAQEPSTVIALPPSPAPQPGLLREPRFITKAVAYFDRKTPQVGEPKDGFYLEMGNMITGAGWLSAGPGYRRHVLNQRAIVSASGGVSVRLYTMAQGSIEFPHLAHNHIRIGAQNLFRNAQRVNYFGLGNDSLVSNRSGYRFQTNDATTYAALGGRPFSVRLRGGWLQPVSLASMVRPAIYPSTVAVFAEREAPGITDQPPYFHADVSAVVDTRDYPGHPTGGGFYQATWATYADQKSGLNTFQRYEADAAQYVALGSHDWILALRGAAVISDTTAGHAVPFYLMPNLGGRNLRGFTDYRFHDRNMQSYTIESRWRVFAHVDGAAFADVGSVAPTIKQLKFRDLKSSYGVGIRLHNNRVTIARLDFGHSVEGWHIFFKMNDPFRRSIESNGWRPVAPFVH